MRRRWHYPLPDPSAHNLYKGEDSRQFDKFKGLDNKFQNTLKFIRFKLKQIYYIYIIEKNKAGINL